MKKCIEINIEINRKKNGSPNQKIGQFASQTKLGEWS